MDRKTLAGTLVAVLVFSLAACGGDEEAPQQSPTSAPSDAAAQEPVEGEVVMEIVVRRDGRVGEVRVLRGLGAGLDQQAIQAVRELCDHVIFAQMTINERGATAFGATPEIFTERLDQWLKANDGDVIGLNCSVGPQIILEAIERVRAHTTRRLSAQPNAGFPRDVGGRQIYLASPEYMAKYAKRLINAGVKFIGGCCGTTSEHIKQIVNAARA